MTTHQKDCLEILEYVEPIISPYDMDRATRAKNDLALEENQRLRLELLSNGFNPDRLLSWPKHFSTISS